MIDWKPGERIVSTCTPVATGVPVTDEWDVVKRGVVKIIQCDPHVGSYLEVGQEYELMPHTPTSYLQVWEIPVENTKRPESSSQVLLYDWKDESPGIEVDC